MPVARTEPRRALAATLAVVVGAVLLVVLVVWISGQGTSTGDGRFADLVAEDLLDRQERDGVPTCFNDPISGERPICVFHTGDDPETGWVAYDAQVAGCELDYRDQDRLTDRCTGESYPFTGEGLPQYAVTVEGGRLVVDLDGEDPTTTTTIVESGEVPGG